MAHIRDGGFRPAVGSKVKTSKGERIIQAEGGCGVSSWKTDEKAFDDWFNQQVYSFGAVPTWTQIQEMKRVWCVARKTLREQKD